MKKKPLSNGIFSKFQTTKIMLFIITFVWLIMTFGMFALYALVNNIPEMNNETLKTIYNLVTMCMVQGCISYIVKSTIENKSKYGNIPYGGAEPPHATEVLLDYDNTISENDKEL